MTITYTGRHIVLAPSQTVELEAEFDKIRKLIGEGKSEAQAHVILRHEHGMNQAEVTVTWRHHEAVGEAEHTDLFAAVHAAVNKVQTQITRQRTKARDTKRVAVPVDSVQ